MGCTYFKINGKLRVKRITLTKRVPFAAIPRVFYAFYAIGMCCDTAEMNRILSINRFCIVKRFAIEKQER